MFKGIYSRDIPFIISGAEAGVSWANGGAGFNQNFGGSSSSPKNQNYPDFSVITFDKPHSGDVETVVYLNGKRVNGSFLYLGGKVKVISRGHRYFRKFEFLEEAIAYHNDWEYVSYWFDSHEGIYYVVINNKMSKAPIKLTRKGSRIEIAANFGFRGACCGNCFEDMGETYKDVAMKGIINIWQGRYFENPPYDFFGMPYVDVVVNIGHEKIKPRNKHGRPINFFIGNKGRGFAPYNILWGIGGNILNAVFCYAYQKNVYYSYDRFAQLAAHEFGHLLGLGDAYKDIWQDAAPITPETPGRFIMRDNSSIVTPNDIEMVLEAFKTNKLQRYTDYYFLFKKSPVVRHERLTNSQQT
ncbi:MAG: hypothetical protein LBV08_09030 [Clostridiales bacterium]|jgi:hypothetical protein|nr:hypothetical protein [Clostridiales bacterium]